MITITRDCTACMACMNSCGVGAIHEIWNENGFIMPEIDETLCIDCGRCEEVCPLTGPSHLLTAEEMAAEQPAEGPAQMPLKAFAMFHSDPAVVEKSSSGGAFYTMASIVLEHGGIVFGCYYDLEKRSAYLTDTDHVTLDMLLTSKYVESYIGDGLQRVEEQLKSGRQVLFCGTPCQAAGLKSFLGRSYDNLLLMDFTCGAVPAQAPLANYLDFLADSYDSKVIRMTFRDKHYGWGQYCFTAEFENGEVYRQTAMADPYFWCFLRSSIQRTSCHGCRFSDAHASDVIVADFWKCDHFDVDRNDRKGISLVLGMTPKGVEAIREASALMHAEELDPKEGAYNLYRRVSPIAKLEEIYRDQKQAYEEGVVALRNRILSPVQREYFALRQQVMDHPEMKEQYPDITGNGQIMV